MNVATRLLLVIVAALLAISHAQNRGYYNYPDHHYFFRSGGYGDLVSPSDGDSNPHYFFRSGGYGDQRISSGGYDVESRNAPARPLGDRGDSRFIFAPVFTTMTFTLTTTTTTITSTASTTCTTSTSSLKYCTAGRRRRGLSGGRLARGLFYNEEAEAGGMESIFLPLPEKSEDVSVEEPAREIRESPPVPFVLESGFRGPSHIGSGRFLLAVATSTVSTTTTTTRTVWLTAICSSATPYSVCVNNG